MGTLLLISGFPGTTKISELRDIVEKYFSHHELLTIWRDPYREARAVGMFQEIIDLKKSLKYHFTSWKNENLVFCEETETGNIFVRAHNVSEFGLIDKLGYLFTKLSRCTVHNKITLGDNCFELQIKEGWDKVLAISKKEWKIGDTKLTVCPYFESFKVPYDDQYQRIQKQDDLIFITLTVDSKTEGTDAKKDIRSEHQTVEHSDNTDSNIISTLVLFSHSLVPKCLKFLNFEKSLKKYNCEYIIGDLETDIVGPKTIVKKIHRLFQKEDLQVSGLIASLPGFNSHGIDRKLSQQRCYHLELAEKNGEFVLEVTKGDGQMMSFQEFVGFLIKDWIAENIQPDSSISQNSFKYSSQVQNSFEDYKFQHTFLISILEALNLKDSVEKDHPGMNLEYDHKNSRIVIKGLRSKIKAIISTLEEEEKNILLDDLGISLLLNETAKEDIKKLNHVIDLSDTSKMVVKAHDDTKLLFSDFVNELIKKETFEAPKADIKKLNTFVDSFNKKNKGFHLSTLQNGVVLVHLSFYSALKNILIKQIKEMLEDITKSTPLNTLSQSFETLNTPINSNQPQAKQFSDNGNFQKKETIKLNFDLSNDQYEFCKMIAQDFKNEKGVKEVVLENCELKIILESCYKGLTHPQISRKIQSFQSQEQSLEFPGLSDFSKLNIGEQIIHEVAQSTKCYISVPSKNTLYVKESEEKDTDYTSIFLHTAKCDGINIHLVQGQIAEIQAQMAISLLPTNEDEIFIQKTGRVHYKLFLPEWGKDVSNLGNLKESLNEKVQLLFQQAIHCKHTEIALSTEELQNTPYPFPLDLLARTILSNLFEYFNFDMGATSARPEFNVYICEPNYKPVFKAFEYFMKRNGRIFGPPDQEKWDQISPQNISTYSEYSQNTVEIKSSNETWVDGNTLFCYPILPSLEAITCPVVNETGASLHSLENALKDIQDESPDGISISNLFPVRCFPGNVHKDVILYCSPHWGIDSTKAIYESLENCIIAATNKFAVYIVPPGIQPNASYPVKYLAQTVFKALDAIFKEGKCHKRLKIFFVIRDYKCRQAFQNELDKRSPQKRTMWSKGVDKFLSYLPFTQEKKTDSPVKKSSTTEVTPVIFVSDSLITIFRAVSELKSKLNQLMSQNKVELDIPNNDAGIIQRLENDLVSLVSWEINTYEQDKHKSKQSKLRSKLTLQGLHRPWVDSIKEDILLRLEKKKAAKSESSSVDKCSKKDRENSKPKKQINSTHAKDSPLMSSSEKVKGTKKSPPITKEKKQEIKFTWRYEKKRNKSFQNFSDTQVGSLEKYYIDDAATNKMLKETCFKLCNFKSIDFLTMTIKTKDDVKKIFRSEILSTDASTVFPENWKMSDAEKFTKVEISHETFNQEFLQNDLCKVLVQLNNFEIIKIEQIQNKELFSRFQEKIKLMLQPKKQYLWHRVSDEDVDNVCKFGFHRVFSSIPKDFSDLGQGVPFTSNVENCFNADENKGELDIFLIYAEVLTGESTTRKRVYRSSPVDNTTGKVYDSVIDAERLMIFSDAQAYPTYLIQLGHKSKQDS